MSVDISAVPPWKQELLEKKRRHEEEERKRKEEEEERLSKMPPWKRDIILRKQQQKNSLVFIGKPELSPRSDASSNGDISSPRSGDLSNYVDESEELTKTVLNHSLNSETDFNSKPVEEHLIPIQQNPWVRIERHKKKSRSPRSSAHYEYNDDGDNNYIDHNVSNHIAGYDTDGHVERAITHNDIGEDVFREPEEEVHYGRGFVNKLRQKFSHLSTNDKARPHSVAVVNLSPKHSRSTESILDEVSKPIHRSISTSDDVDYFVKASIFSPPKARSMENLLSEKKVHSHEADNELNHLEKAHANIPKSLSMGNDVSKNLPANDVEGTSGISGDNPLAIQKAAGSEVYEEELPKANTVSATRTLFEISQSGRTFKRNVSKESLSYAPDNQKIHSTFNDENNSTSNAANRVPKDPLENFTNNFTRRHEPGSATVNTSNESSHVFGSDLSNDQSQDTLQGVRSTGKIWYSSGKEAQETLRQSSRNFDQTDYPVDDRRYENRSPRTGVTADKHVNLDIHSGSQVQSRGSQHAVEPNSIINQKNQRNTDISLTFERSTNDSIYSNSEASTVKSPSWAKKRPAPEPPKESNTRRYGGPTDFNRSTQANKNKDIDTFSSRSDRTKLHLDFSESQHDVKDSEVESTRYTDSDKIDTNSSPSYRDLYFSSRKDEKSSSQSSSSNVDLFDPQESVVDEDDEHLLKKRPVATNNVTQLSESTDSGIGSDSTDTSSHDSGATSAVTVKPALPPNSRSKPPNVSTLSATENKRPTPPNSLPENRKNLPGDSRRATPPSSINISDKKPKRNKEVSDIVDNDKRNASQGPGSLLIRPASNLVSGQNTSNQFLKITNYNDVKTGKFEPPKKRSNFESSRDVPVTNIDDMLDDVPITNIDDIGFSPEISPRSNEIDSDTLRRQAAKKYEFINAEVSLGRSLLVKTRTKKLHINFNETATSTYEYPSEQSLLEEMPPEPGDFDYLDPTAPKSPEDNVELNPAAGSNLLKTPGINPGATQGGGLGTYNPRFTVDYRMGMDVQQEDIKNNVPAPEPVINSKQENADMQIKPAEEDETYSWSNNAASSDMLF